MKLNYFLIPLFTIAVAWFGSLITSRGMAWYRTINLPAWTPAGGVIGAVWTVIFLLATISALLVWNGHRPERLAWIFGLFILNGLLNFAWSYLFFGQHLLGAAVWEAGALGLSVVGLIILIWPLSRLAAGLLLPYAAWVTFATYLTYNVWSLNK
ncbi:MAG: TspO/MBR family protein [Patescibacteria group bacterium]|jgi:tryptophan-rich sensory protein